MKINLKKSAAIQRELESELHSSHLNILRRDTLTLNQDSDACDDITKARNIVKDEFKRFGDLNEILVYLKVKTAEQNVNTGVHIKLADMNSLIRKSDVLNGKKRARPMKDYDEYQKRVERISTNLDRNNDRAYETSFVANLYTEEEIEKYDRLSKDTRRKITQLKDDLLEINVQNHIELDKKQVSLLKIEGLI